MLRRRLFRQAHVGRPNRGGRRTHEGVGGSYHRPRGGAGDGFLTNSNQKRSASPGYAPFSREGLLTIYGRKPVLEALRDERLDCRTLHLAHSNRDDDIVAEIRASAAQRGLPLKLHSRTELARISRNGRQDQGVALDVACAGMRSLDSFLEQPAPARGRRLLALDGITNPQNLGMIIRSATAGGMDGILLPRRGNAALGPLVIKASAGTVFRAQILSCPDLPSALQRCRGEGATVCALAAGGSASLFERMQGDFHVYVLGNETDGISQAVLAVCDRRVAIPMQAGVESLNVAVAASLIAYATYFER